MKKIALPVGVVLLLAAGPTASADTFTVSTTNDAGAGSLRAALAAANGNADADVINVSVTGTISLTTNADAGSNSALEIEHPVTVNGNGVVLDGNDARRVLIVENGGVTLNDLTVQNGRGDCGSYGTDGGGGILQRVVNSSHLLTLNRVRVIDNALEGLGGSSCDSGSGGGGGIGAYGSLSITESTVANNTMLENDGGNGGGGIAFADGTLDVRRSTISGNDTGPADTPSLAGGGGGGIGVGSNSGVTIVNSTIAGNAAGGTGAGLELQDGTMTIINSTIAGNTADRRAINATGGGLYRDAGATVVAKNTIVSGNAGFGSATSANCDGTLSNTSVNSIDDGSTCGLGSANGNMQNTDPLLGTLGAHGGPTQTMLPAGASPAVNEGDATTCGAAPVSAADQRSVPRPQGSSCDIGAVERRAPVVAATAGSGANTAGVASVVDSGLTVTSPDAIANLTGATIAISGGFSAGDTLAVAGGNGITGTYNSGSGVLTLAGTSSVANYEAALRAVTLATSSAAPAGSRTVTFNANEGALSGSATRTVSVALAPAGDPDPDPDPDSDPDPDPVDTTDPRLTAFTVSPASFAAAKRGGSVAAKKKGKKKPKVGTTVSYRLSEAASLEFSVLRRKAGRVSGSECKRRTKKNKGRKKCDLPVGGFSQAAGAGDNSFKFTGRLGGGKLAPARYWMEVSYLDAAGNAGKTAKAPFKIVKR